MRRLLLLVASVAGLAGCQDGTVQVAFRPATGARYDYRVTVTAEVVTRIGDRPERRSTEDDVFTARHSVLSTGDDGSRVEVRVEAAAEEPRTFVVRLDRAGQLAEVQRIEGVPADILGGLGLSEIFPAAAAAPPERGLAPGDRWDIQGLVTGTGRLTALGVVGGRNLATVESDYVLPVGRVADDGGNRVRLDGSQRTTATSTHDLRDGAVQEVRAETAGTFTLQLLPPEGTSGPIVPGTLEVRVRSVTTRLG
ncbi:MAG TPA: hypothetical protein VM938_06655 [Acidimicrobiales bacterium]|nr:hypothetical protein [Acidimicrobiales bacterium]